MAKRIDPLKAKEAKQKKIAIALGVVLLAVGAFQGPKTLKMLKGSQPATSAVPVTPTATPPATTPPGTTAPNGGLPAPATPQQDAVLADSDLPPAASASQLLSFEQFQTKDPFAQQVDLAETADDGAPSGADSGSGADQQSTAPDAGSGTGSNPQDDPNAPPPSFSAPGSGDDPAPDAPQPAAATKISINGVVETVATKATFPADEPVFQLVSLGRDGKSVQIGVAGGSYATGEPTIKLLLGKVLTLQNTADGSRYELKLLTVEGFVPPKPKK